MTTVLVSTDPLSVDSYERHEVADVREFLIDRFGAQFPATARIYHQHVALSADVTPSDEAGIAALGSLPGPFFVIVYPATGWETMAMIWLITTVASLAMSSLLTPAMKTPTSKHSTTNNALSGRSNRERVGDRIPDIYGLARAYPDLLAQTYSVFDDHQEVEHALMCVGRGAYQIEKARDPDTNEPTDHYDVRDGTTLVENIAGAGVEFYGPGQPVPSEVPDLRLGNAIRNANRDPLPVLFARRSEAVTGQELPGKSDQVLQTQVYFTAPDTINLPENAVDSNGQPVHFSTFFSTGGKLRIEDATLARSAEASFLLTFVSVSGYGQDGAIRFAPDQVLPSALSVGDEIEIGPTVAFPSYAGRYVVTAIEDLTVRLKVADTNAAVPWTSTFGPGGQSQVMNIVIGYPQGDDTLSANLDGYYTIVSVDDHTIVLNNPADEVQAGGTKNTDWLKLALFNADGVQGKTPTVTVKLSQKEERWIGPFVMTYPNATSILCNFVADQGLYGMDENGTQYAGFPDPGDTAHKDADGNVNGVWIKVQVQQVDGWDRPKKDGDGVEIPWEEWEVCVKASAATRRTRAATIEVKPTWMEGKHSGRFQIRVARTTRSYAYRGDLASKYQDDTYVDSVTWRDLYAMAKHDGSTFGNVTTVRTMQRATPGAFALKERKFSALVTRKVRKRNDDGTLAETESTPSRNAADIFCTVALDPRIGGRNASELDVAGIYDAVAKVRENFGFQDVVTEFSHTFDDLNTSYEETASAIANAVFCVAYRQGAKIRLKPEIPTEDSVLLFNHRNKIPASETRTIRFGSADQHDGVEFQYTSPKDDSRVTLSLPTDGSAINPERVDSVGIRSAIQAYYHAARLWMKQQYQHVAVEFEATQEADLLVPGDRILVADNTRPDVQDGEVLGQSGLVLELSQPVSLGEG